MRKGEIAHMHNFSFPHSVFKRLELQTCKNQGLFGKGLMETILCSQSLLHDKLWIRWILPITTQYCILMHLRCIAVENIVRKGKIACNKQFLLFSQCFLPYMVLIFHFKFTIKMLSAICFNLDQSKILSSGNG